MKLENNNKAHFEDYKIKSNILNYVVLKITYKGLLSFDAFIEDFNTLLTQKGFVAEKDVLSPKDVVVMGELEAYNESLNEPVVRFVKNKNTSRIVVTRSFTYIYLDYEAAHKLTSNIEIFSELIKTIRKLNNFVIFEKVTLKKNNGVIVNNTNNILECFETRVFNNSPLEINRIDKNKNVNLLFSKSSELFRWNEILYVVTRKIQKGKTKFLKKDGSVKEKQCYEITLDIQGTIILEVFEQENKEYFDDIESKIKNINSGLFEIFKLNTSSSFLRDMIEGESKKIIGGLNKNEEI
ncbi:hypothetical protein [Clostridium intestinale]|uniref:hypothetical protein n=1 Tax=Clostridium intestinale TaxID=36845 RepID=UPI002DD640D2|nr:hypothetical protein [Clostridium intestinale]WRY53396.1 hypothetical protein P8F83_09345 [Clostridium intestinale]